MVKRIKPIKKLSFSSPLKVKDPLSSRIFDIVNIILLIAIAFVMIYPMYYVILLSFSEGSDVLKGGLWLFPRTFTIDNYLKVFSNKDLVMSFGVSIARTVIGTVLSVFLLSLLAYALSVKTLPGRRFLNKFFFFTTIFSGGAIPTLLLLKKLDMLNDFSVYVIPALYSFFSMLIIRTQFESVPASLKESAKIDGASDFRIFFDVYLPLSKSALATVALFTAVFHWGDWFAGSYYVSLDYLKPAATILQEMLNEALASESQAMSGYADALDTTSTTLQMAFVVVITFPIMVVYPFLQKYFTKGALIGSIKE